MQENKNIILDCYTDEPAGLGVPPYIGTYPRYLYGALKDAVYLTIDDLRLYKNKDLTDQKYKTNIRIHNLSKNFENIDKIYRGAKNIIVVAGIQTPGKYLSALPGTLHEISGLLDDFRGKKILTGPAGGLHGTRLEGGKFAEKIEIDFYDEVDDNFMQINEFKKIKEYSIKGAEIVKQFPFYPNAIAEIETGRGCVGGKCSFCVEPFKKLEFREKKDILEEIIALYRNGIRYFRLGKQSCFYSYKNSSSEDIESLLKAIRENCPEIKVLHIDNVNPMKVITENGIKITKSIVEYCTEGNIAAFGVESFDKEVIKANNLNSNPESVMKAIEIINKHGRERGKNGLPKFLPGINIIFGLNKESKKTHEENMFWLNQILEKDLLVRRINIRQATILDKTALCETVGIKFLKKNRKYYWSWRNEIRQKIDFPMLQKILPKGAVLKNVRTEIYDGKTTFGRQIATYPLIVGIEQVLPLEKFFDVRITKHMLRSVTAKVI